MRAIGNGRVAVFAVLAVVAGMLASGALVWQASQAAFTKTTDNGANNWNAGSVTITDDDSSAVMFNVSNLKPTSTGSKCIAVTYSGNLASSIKLYATPVTGTLAAYLDIVIEEGSVGTFANCGAFSATATPYTGTLSAFGTGHGTYATGVGTWTPSSTSTKVFKFTYTLNAATPDSQQGASAAATFIWEAQNT